MLRRLLAMSLSVSMALAPLPAFADSYDAAMARAAAAKEKALDANDPGSWQETLRLFEEADTIRSTKESRYEVASAAAWLKQEDLAVEAYEDAIAMGIGGPAKTKAEAYLAARTGKMGRLRIKGPAGATVSIEGHVRARLPRDRAVVVFPGKVRLHVEKTEGASDVEVEAKAGVDTDVSLDEKPKAPLAPAPVAPAPAETGGDHRQLGWVLTASGAVVLGFSVYGVLVANSRISRNDDDLRGKGCNVVDHYCSSPFVGTLEEGDSVQALSDQNATWKAVRTTGIIGTIVGAGAAITGVVLVVTSKSKPQPISPEVSVLPGAAYFGLRGAF
jgi:hypothetical protein